MAATSDMPIIDLNANDWGNMKQKRPICCQVREANGDIDDDVFFSENIKTTHFITTKDVQTNKSVTAVQINILPSAEVIMGRDATCQTDFSSLPISREVKASRTISSSSPRVKIKRVSTSKSPTVKNTFCWRHDAYDIQEAPARASSPSSAISCDNEEISKERTQQVVLHQGACSICKSAEERRLHLKSRRELSAHRKVSAEPTIATVKNCPSNLLQDFIPNCSEVWTENQTFYLGTNGDRPIKTSESLRRRRIHSVPTQTELNKCFYCQENVPSIDLKNHPRSYCKQHSFRIRSLSFNTKGQPSYFPKWTKSPKSGRRDWLLVQRVIKKLPADSQNIDMDKIKPHYCENGPQEMIFCLQDLRTVSYIEDICCQHFLLMSRQEAQEKGKIVELLFSSQGPVVRDDKHLKGRSLYYFCCHVEKAKPKRSSSFTKPPPYNPELALKTKKEKEENKYKSIFEDSDASKKKRGNTTKRTKEDMRKNSRKDLSAERSKKTVTFSDDVKEEKENVLQPCDGNTEESGIQRRSSLPPPPKLKLTEEDDDDVTFRRRRRESVAISFSDQPTSKKPDKLQTLNEAPVVASYQKKQWKTIQINVSFKDMKFSGEFFEYKSLQDLYTWLRQELLKEEILSPGADLLLTHENLKFPLKANTATKVLSSLPTTVFHCNEIIKASINDGGFGESTSKYDTRFALPLDTRELEGLNPVQYLGKYCIVSSTWKAFYLSIFSSYDKWKRKKLNYKEVCSAMERLFVELAYPLLKRVVNLMGFDAVCEQTTYDNNNDNGNKNDDWKSEFSVGPEEFISMCSLANRIICREDEIDGFHVNTIKQRNTHLEDADFFNIEGKIRDHKIHPLTKRLLLYVRNKPS